jgi:anti-sigma regulatory factor (Ser/Thr protein kinase)
MSDPARLDWLPGGDVAQVGCTFADVSERVQAERALVESEERRQSLVSMPEAEEAERSRIATELPMDRVAIAARKTGQEAIEAAVTLARATLEEATDRARRLMFELRPAILYERGLSPALGMLVDQTARETGAVAEVRAHVGRHDRAVEELVYRTVQEALSNIRKHAHPTRIRVVVDDEGQRLAGEVADDGLGFDVERAKARPRAALHLGLDSIAERLLAVGGDVEVGSSPGSGTRLRFTRTHRRPARPWNGFPGREPVVFRAGQARAVTSASGTGDRQRVLRSSALPPRTALAHGGGRRRAPRGGAAGRRSLPRSAEPRRRLAGAGADRPGAQAAARGRRRRRPPGRRGPLAASAGPGPGDARRSLRAGTACRQPHRLPCNTGHKGCH